MIKFCFQVRRHKTNHVYGAVRVHVNHLSNLLKRYGEFRSSSGAADDMPLFNLKFHIGKIWKKEVFRLKRDFPFRFNLLGDVTHTSYRKYVETKVRKSCKQVMAQFLYKKPSFLQVVERKLSATSSRSRSRKTCASAISCSTILPGPHQFSVSSGRVSNSKDSEFLSVLISFRISVNFASKHSKIQVSYFAQTFF